MNHYDVLRAQILDDIQAAWGETIKVAFGRTFEPFTNLPRAVVTLYGGDVTRKGSALRTVRQSWGFEIAGFFALPSSGDLEPEQMAKIDLLLQQLEPYSEVSVPSSPGPYAGIADIFSVANFSPMPFVEGDGYYGVRLRFECETEVYS